MRNDFLVVDGDGHIVEVPDLWTSRMDKNKWGDWIPRYVEESDGEARWYHGGVLRSKGAGAVASAAGMDIMELIMRRA